MMRVLGVIAQCAAWINVEAHVHASRRCLLLLLLLAGSRWGWG